MRWANVIDSAMGFTYIFKATQPAVVTPQDTDNIGLSYYLMPISLSMVLTIMVVTRVVAQSKKIRNTTEAGGLYEVAIVVLTEPCAPYTANFFYLSKRGGLGPTLRIPHDQFSPKLGFVMFAHFPDISQFWNEVEYSR